MIELADYFPLLIAPNTSIGIVLIKRMLQSISSELNLFSTPRIYERHHKEKKDAPSGTALDLSKELNKFKNFESVFTPNLPTYNLNCRFSDFESDFTNEKSASFWSIAIVTNLFLSY